MYHVFVRQAVAELEEHGETGLEQAGGNKRHPCHHVTSRPDVPSTFRPVTRGGGEVQCTGGATQMETASMGSPCGGDGDCTPAGHR